MGKRPTFTLPEGLKIEITDEKISIEYDGDVEIEQDLGRRFAGLRVGGDLTVKLPGVTGDLVAGGVLRVLGDVDGGMLHGREIVLGRQNIKCKSISAVERITIGAATVACDVILAPEINLDPKISGRVTVIESLNERGATKIKGGFSLADYEDMFGNSNDFLTQRGLSPLSTRDLATPGPLPSAPVAQHAAPEIRTAPEPTRPVLGATPVPPAVRSPDVRIESARNAELARTPPAPPMRPPRRPKEDEDVDDPLSLSLDDLEPLVDQHERPRDDDLQQRLVDALGRITSCYEGAELPPAVQELRTLVERRDYDALRTNITEVWNGLLGFHQKRGIRPHHQVTHAFNVIHGLVQA